MHLMHLLPPKRLAWLATLGLLLPASAWCTVRHVPADAPTIQAALNASTFGDEIIVAAGTYHENLNIFAAMNGVNLHSESGAAVTIIDGSRLTSVIHCSGGVGTPTHIDGFTITNGGDNPPTVTIGGGFHLDPGASPTITNNDIHDNHGAAAGGIYADGSAAIIENNVIHDNDAQYGSGGGIYYDHSSTGQLDGNEIHHNHAGAYGGGITIWEHSAPTIVNNNIHDNGADLLGGGFAVWFSTTSTISGNQVVANHSVTAGGFYLNGCQGTVSGNTIANNSAPGGSGGGIYCDHFASTQIDHNVIDGNIAGAYGGGITEWEGSTSTVLDNTIVANQAPLGGGGVYVTRNSHPNLTGDIVAFNMVGGGIVVGDPESTVPFECDDTYGNTPADYTGVANPTGANGNQSLDPLFCDALTANYHLMSTSPCASAHSPGSCGLVGALDVGCGSVPTIHQTWGRLKATYR